MTDLTTRDLTNPNELELLRQIALKANEFFESDDLWIDGIRAGYRAGELKKLLEQWQSFQPAHKPGPSETK